MITGRSTARGVQRIWREEGFALRLTGGQHPNVVHHEQVRLADPCDHQLAPGPATRDLPGNPSAFDDSLTPSRCGWYTPGRRVSNDRRATDSETAQEAGRPGPLDNLPGGCSQRRQGGRGAAPMGNRLVSNWRGSTIRCEPERWQSRTAARVNGHVPARKPKDQEKQ